MQCVHRKAADARWRLFPLLALISLSSLTALADDTNTTLPDSSEAVTTIPLAETSTLLAKSTSILNEASTTNLFEVSTKSVEVPTEIPEGTTKKSEVASEKVEVSVITNVETTGRAEEKVEKKRVEKHNETTEKVTTQEKIEAAEKPVVTEENVRVTSEKPQEEESQTESASELALQSVQLAVTVKAPKMHGMKSSSGNSTDEFEQDDEYGGYEGSEIDDDSDDDGDEFGSMEYEEDEDDTKSRSEVSSTVSTTVASSTLSTSTTVGTSTTDISPDDKDDVELIKVTDDSTESSTSTAPAPRRPRHSQSKDYEYGAIAPPTSKPRRRRPNHYKDERRVLYTNGYYPGRSLKRRKNTKERPLKPTTTLAPIQTTTESYLKSYNQVLPDTEKAVPTTTPVPRRRMKRRKKKVRRQKQSKSQERQIPAETRTAIEAAAAAAAAESLAGESDSILSPSTTVSTERIPTTAGPRSVRQNDADISIQQSEVNPDGSYSFSYDIADEGRQSREEVGGSDRVVNGRYSFTDANGKAVQRVYSAGPRGFRATGDDIARKMDLSQLGPAPIPPPDGRYSPEYDRYSDPNEDPSYEFQYKTGTSSRRESADSRGDVKGRYSFYDDDGERHDVSYYAGAEKGFNVRTAFPDNDDPLPLFFRGSGVPPRGRSSILQHRNGAYRFTAVGPDSRREECSDSSNYRRGSYIYLDDKGIQRTVVYEAGPNIGFRIIANPAATPRCPPSKGELGWQNKAIEVGIDPPYYRPPYSFGAPNPPTSTYRPPFSFSTDPTDIVTDDSTYPVTPYEPPKVRPQPSKPGETPKPWTPITRPQPGMIPRPSPGTIPRPSPGTIPRPSPGTIPRPSPGTMPRPSPRPIPGQSPGSLPRPSPSPSPRPSTGGPDTTPITGTYKPPASTPGGLGHSPSTNPPKEPCRNGGSSDCSPDFLEQSGSPGHPPKRPEDGGNSYVQGHKSAFDEIFNTSTVTIYPPNTGGSAHFPPDTGGSAIFPPEPPPIRDPRPLPSPYPPYRHFSCCVDRLFVDSAIDGHPAKIRPIRTYVQSIDLSTEDENGPGRAESPSVALERHVREHEHKASRREQRRRRRRRRSAP